jgi:hypothetical protein
MRLKKKQKKNIYIKVKVTNAHNVHNNSKYNTVQSSFLYNLELRVYEVIGNLVFQNAFEV